MKRLKAKLKSWIIRLSKVRYMNRGIVFLLDVFLSVFSTLLVILFIRFGLWYKLSLIDSLLLCGVSLVSTFLSILAFRTYANVIRYSTLREVWRLLMMVVVKECLCALPICFTEILPHRQLAFFVADFFVTIVVLLCFRIFLLNVYNLIQMTNYSKKKNILIYGIGEESVILAQGTSRIYMLDYLVRGFLVMDPKKRRFMLSGMNVYSANSVEGTATPT